MPPKPGFTSRKDCARPCGNGRRTTQARTSIDAMHRATDGRVSGVLCYEGKKWRPDIDRAVNNSTASPYSKSSYTCFHWQSPMQQTKLIISPSYRPCRIIPQCPSPHPSDIHHESREGRTSTATSYSCCTHSHCYSTSSRSGSVT
jgi:hypothetical protein